MELHHKYVSFFPKKWILDQLRNAISFKTTMDFADLVNHQRRRVREPWPWRNLSYRRWAWTHSRVFTVTMLNLMISWQPAFNFHLNWLCHIVPLPNVHVHTKFEEIWSVSFQMAAKRMFLVNNLVTMATSFEFSPKLTLPHCAPPQCACPYQIWRDLVSKFSNGSQKNVFGKQLGYHGNQFWIFT